MQQLKLNRRNLLAVLGASGLSAAIHAGEAEEENGAARTPQEALQRLLEGNERFVSGQTRHAHRASDWRKHLVAGQQPIATILGCSDSRIPPELVFDQGFGDVFVIRVAGNTIEPAVFGSIGYAVVHLKTALLVVLGHEKCGAITAACDGLFRNVKQSRGIEGLLQYIKPGLKDIDPTLPADKQVEIGIETNIRFAIRQLAESPEGRRSLAEQRLQIVGGVYELETGRVRLLN